MILNSVNLSGKIVDARCEVPVNGIMKTQCASCPFRKDSMMNTKIFKRSQSEWNTFVSDIENSVKDKTTPFSCHSTTVRQCRGAANMQGEFQGPEPETMIAINSMKDFDL
jgi:hypothetical protein